MLYGCVNTVVDLLMDWWLYSMIDGCVGESSRLGGGAGGLYTGESSGLGGGAGGLYTGESSRLGGGAVYTHRREFKLAKNCLPKD